MKKRNLDITEQTINCFGDLEVDLDEGFIEAAYELWFDVDRYFGTDTRDKDDTWINFYTRWHPDRTITAIYFVESDETVKEHTWELTPKEQEFFRKKMEAYAKTQGNQTLQEIWEETKDYIELPTTKNPNKKVYQQDTEKIEDKIDSQGYITGIVYVVENFLMESLSGSSAEFSITATEIRKMLNLAADGWICEKIEENETLYIRFTKGKEEAEFELVKC